MKVTRIVKLDEPKGKLVGYAWIENDKGDIYCLKITQGNRGTFVSVGSYYMDGTFEPFFKRLDEDEDKRFRKSINDSYRTHIDQYGFENFNANPEF